MCGMNCLFELGMVCRILIVPTVNADTENNKFGHILGLSIWKNCCNEVIEFGPWI